MEKSGNSLQTRGTKTILRVFDILESIGQEPNGLGLAEISEKISLPKSTVHRIISALQERQYIRESYSNGKYLLGYQVLNLAKSCLDAIDILKNAHPYLEAINKEFNETVILGVLDNNNFRIIYLDKIDTSHSLRLVSHIGERAPVHCTALGKAILSKFNEAEIREKFKDYELRKFTENTITDLDILIKNLKEINQMGYTIDREEYKPHVSCIAAPICGFLEQPIAAISVSIPTTRFSEERMEQIICRVVNACNSISKVAGFTKTQEIW